MFGNWLGNCFPSLSGRVVELCTTEKDDADENEHAVSKG